MISDLDTSASTFDSHLASRRLVFGILLFVLLGLSGMSLLIRADSVIRVGDLFTSTGTEEAPIYSVWKVVHHYPLYESPLTGDYGLGLYNWLFYVFYGSFIRALGCDGSSLVLAGRLLTLLCAVLGCIGYQRILAYLTSPLTHAWSWTLSALIWADAGEAGWWQLSIRPDFAALAMATWALWIFLRAYERKQATLVLLSSLLFYTAWSFKQSTILIFAASCIVLLLWRRWTRGFCALAFPFATLVALTFYLGGHNYVLNTVYAPSINAFILSDGVRETGRAILASPFIWLAGAIGAASLLLGQCRIAKDDNSSSFILHFLLVSYAITVIADFVGICRQGSARNTLFEAFLVSGILAALVTADVFSGGPPLIQKRIWGRLLFGIAFSNALLLLIRLGPFTSFGRLTLASHHDFATRLKLTSEIQQLPAPVFVREGMLSLPWIANRNQYPAVMDDVLFYEAAMKHGALIEYPIKTLVTAHHFRTLLVGKEDRALDWALTAGCTLPVLQTFTERSLTRVDCDAGPDGTPLYHR